MDEYPFPLWLVLLFPLIFAGFWLLVTQFLSALSGWAVLQERYPDREGQSALFSLRFQSATIGTKRVNYKNALTLSATRIGLRVSVWWPFGLFQSPFLVPWEHIHAEPVRLLFINGMLLRFGDPERGRMIVRPGTWERLVQASRGDAARLRAGA